MTFPSKRFPCCRFVGALCSLLLLLLLPVAFPAQAQATSAAPSSPASRPTLPSDLVKYFAGTWAGKGNFASSGKPIESEISFTFEPENQCILVRDAEKPPNTFHFVAILSVDSISGETVMLMASNHDAGARVLRTGGWRDGKLVFQGVPELHAFFSLERFTFEKISSTVFHATYEMSFDGGKTWRVGDRQEFTKLSS